MVCRTPIKKDEKPEEKEVPEVKELTIEVEELKEKVEELEETNDILAKRVAELESEPETDPLKQEYAVLVDDFHEYLEGRWDCEWAHIKAMLDKLTILRRAFSASEPV